MVKVSVIIPIYNTEKYLKKCLNSLTHQTLSDIEIICVNDGSTDKSIDILRNFASQDHRIKIIEQENKKQGAARNAGMKIAQGEYIGFVDSDDWVDLDYFEKLYISAIKHKADISLGTNVRINKNIFKKRLNIKEENVYISLQDKLDVNIQWKNPCPTNKIYKKTLFEKYDIKWPEGVYCEDKIFTLKSIYYANAVVSVPNVNYYYYKNPSSTVNNKKIQHLKKVQADKNNANYEVIRFLREQNANVRDKNFWAITKEFKLFNLSILKISESIKSKKICFLGFIPVYCRNI